MQTAATTGRPALFTMVEGNESVAGRYEGMTTGPSSVHAVCPHTGQTGEISRSAMCRLMIRNSDSLSGMRPDYRRQRCASNFCGGIAPQRVTAGTQADPLPAERTGRLRVSTAGCNNRPNLWGPNHSNSPPVTGCYTGLREIGLSVRGSAQTQEHGNLRVSPVEDIAPPSLSNLVRAALRPINVLGHLTRQQKLEFFYAASQVEEVSGDDGD